MKTHLKNEQETLRAGAAFAKKLHGGDIVLLHGELGAGKTTFVKGMAKELGVKETITSPTFALMNVYRIPNDEIPRLRPASRDFARDDITAAAQQLCHIDTYRLKNADELRAIGAEDYIGEPHTITVIEWPEKIATLLPAHGTKNIFFRHVDGGRSITVQ